MSRWWIVGALSVALATAAAHAQEMGPAGGVPAPVDGIIIEGTQQEFDPATNLYTVTGNARAFRGQDEVHADRLVVNQATMEAVAEGNVLLKSGDRLVRARRATYNFRGRQGTAEEARTIFRSMLVQAARITTSQTEYIAHNAKFSTCDLEEPHYELSARRMIIRPNERFIAENVGVDLLGTRLITVPQLSRSLRPDDDEDENNRQSLIPAFGHNSRDGFFAHKDFELVRKQSWAADLDFLLGTGRGPRAELGVATRGQVQWVGALSYQEDAPNQRSRFLEVHRLPEVGLVWRNRRERPRPGGFLPFGVGDPGQEANTDRGWRLGAHLTAGYFIQDDGEGRGVEDSGDREGSRLQAQVSAWKPDLNLGPLRLDSARVLLRESVYDTGDSYFVAGLGLRKEWRLAQGLDFRLQRLDYLTAGNTPFAFDDVELRHEWRPGVELRRGDWNLAYFARVKDNGGLYDQLFAVSKRIHCLEPRFSYSTRRQQFMFDLRIEGLSPNARLAPEEGRLVGTRRRN